MSPRDFAERFWEKVRKSPGDGCWEWTANRVDNRYGRITTRLYQSEYAHRISWMLTRGDPGSLFVLHHCDNMGCVRPDHLFLGTNRDNAIDMCSKGRYRGHYGLKLSDTQVAEIRALKGVESQRSIASRYGVCGPHVCRIMNWEARDGSTKHPPS